MRKGWVGVALICVISVFLFPAGNGPFSATHGPATALRAKRAALFLTLAILAAAMLTLASRANLSMCVIALAALSYASGVRNSSLLRLTSVLLC